MEKRLLTFNLMLLICSVSFAATYPSAGYTPWWESHDEYDNSFDYYGNISSHYGGFQVMTDNNCTGPGSCGPCIEKANAVGAECSDEWLNEYNRCLEHDYASDYNTSAPPCPDPTCTIHNHISLPTGNIFSLLLFVPMYAGVCLYRNKKNKNLS